MAMSVEISVIIPNWNGRAHLERCLGSLNNQEFSDFEVVVVDNGSTDGSVEFLRRNFQKTKIVAFMENEGFAKAVNEGIKKAGGEYVLLLNNDVEADSRLLSQLHEAIAHSNSADFYACRMMNFMRRELLDGAGDGLSRKGKAFRIGHDVEYGSSFQRRRRVFGACAGAGFYRKELFEKVGLFDEDFFAYQEDADWNFRANLMGYRCLYIPEAVVYHIGSATTGSRHNEFTVYYNVQNIISLIIKNMPLKLLFKYSPFILWGQLGSFVRHCILLNYSKAYFAGLWGAIRLLRKMLKKRKEIQGRRRISLLELEELLIVSEKERKGKIRPIENFEPHGH